MTTPPGRAESDTIGRREVLQALGATAALVGLSPVISHSASPERRIVWGSGSNATNLDPQTSATWVDNAAYEALYDTLVHRRPPPDHRPLVPRLATEWRLLNDVTWQFKLRKNVSFHNGDPCTAEDVKFTFESAIDPKSRNIYRAQFRLLKSVEVVDDHTVNFVLSGRDPLWPGRLAWSGSRILPAKYYQKVGPEGFSRAPVGTGAYKFGEFVKDDHLTLVANPGYWGGAPNATELTVRSIPDAAARLTALLSTDEINFTDNVPYHEIDRVKRNPKTKVLDLPYNGNYTLTPNLRVKPLDNVLVRRALSVAIDRESIVKQLLRGRGAVPSGMITPEEFSYDPKRPKLAYDAAMAKRLLQQAGYGNEPVILETTRNYIVEPEQELGEALVQMWKDVGINAKLELLETSVRTQKIAQRAFKGIFTAGFASPLFDPDSLMWRVLQDNGLLNYGWTNEEFQKLGVEATTSLDSEVRRRNFQRMADIVNEEVPIIVVMEFIQNFGAHRYINFRPGPSLVLDFRAGNLSFGS
jgi:peptide/nickel transport system substrate-binding protein